MIVRPMNNTPALREGCARKLLGAATSARRFTAFVGLDGFVDEILHVVDKRESAEQYHRMPTIGALAERIKGAAGKSTNLEVVNQRTKLGGNGPIMANALASFGFKVTYLGMLGYPTMHPVFNEFAQRAEVHTIGEPGHTDALEFEDGKIMVGKHSPLKDMNWANIQTRFGKKKFAERFASADLVGFVNWTMLPYMSDVWEALLSELCPALKSSRRTLFFDLADPEKRSPADLRRALQLIASFEKYFNVTLGLNEKEAGSVAEVLGIPVKDHSAEGLSALGLEINRRVPTGTLAIHPVKYALAVSAGKATVMEGLYTNRPLITTGAGDHFNAGFCLGKMLGLDNALSLLIGVTNSGHYVRTAHSPTIADLAATLRHWPTD
jgi:hypothetical protein